MIPATLAHEVRETLVDYLRTTFHFRDTQLEAALLTFLRHPEHGLFRGPFIDLRLPFRKASSDGTVPLSLLPGFTPYVHQLRAWERLSSKEERAPQATLVTTGTGSGKTECFLYPLLDHCLRAAERGELGIKAIVLYPMNALASDQAARFAKEIHQDPALRQHVSAGLYVGGQGEQTVPTASRLVDDRRVLRQAPPDILLTNYKMLDYLLMRPEDRALWRFNEPDTLRYLVLDELHSYDGAQGSDVACLLRRLKARLSMAPGALVCVGTSATIGGERSARELCRFASEIFDVTLDDAALVREDRLTLSEAFPPHGPDEVITRDAFDCTAAELDPASYASAEAYVEAQAGFWLGHVAPSPVALGEQLGRHDFLRRLLEALHGREKAPTTLRCSLGAWDTRSRALPPCRRNSSGSRCRRFSRYSVGRGGSRDHGSDHFWTCK